jgi:hypothetical protein
MSTRRILMAVLVLLVAGRAVAQEKGAEEVEDARGERRLIRKP